MSNYLTPPQVLSIFLCSVVVGVHVLSFVILDAYHFKQKLNKIIFLYSIKMKVTYYNYQLQPATSSTWNLTQSVEKRINSRFYYKLDFAFLTIWFKSFRKLSVVVFSFQRFFVFFFSNDYSIMYYEYNDQIFN